MGQITVSQKKSHTFLFLRQRPIDFKFVAESDVSAGCINFGTKNYEGVSGLSWWLNHWHKMFRDRDSNVRMKGKIMTQETLLWLTFPESRLAYFFHSWAHELLTITCVLRESFEALLNYILYFDNIS